jgi:hypothetical protein
MKRCAPVASAKSLALAALAPVKTTTGVAAVAAFARSRSSTVMPPPPGRPMSRITTSGCSRLATLRAITASATVATS